MTFILVLRHSIEKPSLASFRCLIGLEAAWKRAIWRHSGLMVSAVDSGPSGSGLSPDGGHCFVFFGKTLDSRRPFLAFPYFVRGRYSWCCCSLSRSKPGPCYWHATAWPGHYTITAQVAQGRKTVALILINIHLKHKYLYRENCYKTVWIKINLPWFSFLVSRENFRPIYAHLGSF